MRKGEARPDGEYGPTLGQVGRKYPQRTRLAKLMAYRGLTATETARLSRVHPRTLTEYLAGRDEIRPHHLAMLAEVLECSPGKLHDDPAVTQT